MASHVAAHAKPVPYAPRHLLEKYVRAHKRYHLLAVGLMFTCEMVILFFVHDLLIHTATTTLFASWEAAVAAIEG